MNEHWSKKYIGRPWVQGGRSMEAFDCWGLLCLVYKERFDFELPSWPNTSIRDFWRIMNHTINFSPEWSQVYIPFEGCAVAIGGNEIYHHVGVYVEVDGGLILHSANVKNTTAQNPAAIRAQGLQRIAYFKHNGVNYRNPKSV